VFGGSLHATGIKGVELIVKNFEQLRTKKVIIFAVGCSPAREEAIQHVKDVNFTDECKVKVKFFYFRGAFDYHKLSFIDKMMMYMLKIKLKIKKEEELDEDSRGLLACYHQPVDWTNKGDIQAIAQCIKEE
jgi:menaquinone-dependent protoporphyrinogen IX oxidase